MPAGERLRVLLTESASAAAREILTVLARHGHVVHVLEPRRDGMTAVSTAIRRRHPVPAFSTDPGGYLEALERVLVAERIDVLLPTHEQVALVSRFADRLRPLGAGFAVPGFDALATLQDKASTTEILERLGIPAPPTRLVGSAAELRRAAAPAFVKLPISTASAGVWHVADRADMERVAGLDAVADTFRRGRPVLVQEPVDGPVAMVQVVFDRGRPVAAHAALRVRDGVRGSAASKVSEPMPELVGNVERLGRHLDWHGALSVDAVRDDEHRGTIIDVNPRLCEPVPSDLAGTDLVGRMLAVSRGEPVGEQPPAVRENVRTHMLMMALLRHGELGNGRSDVARELVRALTSGGLYAGSTEELMPVRWDPGAAVTVTAVALGMLASPGIWRRFVDGRPPAHTLTPDTWEWLQRDDEPAPPR